MPRKLFATLQNSNVAKHALIYLSGNPGELMREKLILCFNQPEPLINCGAGPTGPGPECPGDHDMEESKGGDRAIYS